MVSRERGTTPGFFVPQKLAKAPNGLKGSHFTTLKLIRTINNVVGTHKALGTTSLRYSQRENLFSLLCKAKA